MPEMIKYNGEDITDYVSASHIVHEMYAGGHADTLDIRFDDPDRLWPRWTPAIGDTISYQNEGTSTGEMYIFDVKLDDPVEIYATCIPPYLRDTYSKTWEEVYLSQILSEVTTGYQLNGLEDVWYRYKACDEKLYKFLNEMATLEGAISVFYNGKVILVNEEALESQAGSFEIDSEGAEVTITDGRAGLFDACVVQSGSYFGSYRISKGERLYRPAHPIRCSSDAEAFRYAKALLRQANKGMTDIKWTGPMIPELSAGVCIDLIYDEVPLWSGRKYCYRVRHDYGKGETTIYMRNPLGGY